MKKLFFVFMLLLATVFATNAIAQVYIDDPCTKGKPGVKWWNVNKISDIGAVHQISSDGLPWAAWFYDPKGQIFAAPVTDKIKELSVVESNVIHVNETGDIFFKMDFYVRTLTRSNMRNFGARIRPVSSNEWDTIFTLQQDGVFPVYRNGHIGTADVCVGDKYNGKNIIFQIFFYNDEIAEDAFIVGFRNVLLVSYDTKPKVETQLLSRQYAYGDAYSARLKCINRSLTSIKSVEYVYSVNGKAKEKQNVTFADSLKSKSDAVAIDFVFDITGADIDAANRIKFWPVSINGEAYTPVSDDTLDFELVVVDESRLNQHYNPILECFTSATCPPCRILNPYLNPVLIELKNAGKLNVVKYQVNWPGAGDKYYILGNSTRATYYDGISVAPTLVFNGVDKWDDFTDPKDGSYSPALVLNTLRDMADAASQNKAFFSIKVNTAKVTPESTVELDFDVISHLPGNQLRRMNIHAMVIEGTTHGNQVVNTEKDFHYVNMAFATPATGKGSYFTEESNTQNYTYTVDMTNTNMEDPDDLQVVIFVQDPEDQYIYQSMGIKMGEGEMSSEEDQELTQVSIYPNPAANTVYVAGLEKARVEIFDLTGRKVYENADADGVLEVSLASFAKGTYVVRIAQKGVVASRKLVVK